MEPTPSLLVQSAIYLVDQDPRLSTEVLGLALWQADQKAWLDIGEPHFQVGWALAVEGPYVKNTAELFLGSLPTEWEPWLDVDQGYVWSVQDAQKEELSGGLSRRLCKHLDEALDLGEAGLRMERQAFGDRLRECMAKANEGSGPPSAHSILTAQGFFGQELEDRLAHFQERQSLRRSLRGMRDGTH